MERRVSDINDRSLSTAKLSLLLELGLAGFGGNGDKVRMDCDRYLPFVVHEKELKPQKTYLISKKTAQLFWQLQQTKKLPGFVERAFLVNKELMQILEELK